MPISVCIATYNGEKYIKKQLMSILGQIKDNDEVIIVDDNSKDGTINEIENIKDNRISIFTNEHNRGHVFSFGRALELASHEIIFMSDQDDIWTDGRVELMLSKLKEGCASLVTSYFGYIDNKGREISNPKKPLSLNDSTKYFSNILGIFLGTKNYFGCAMACNKELLKIILPIPQFVESHDLWIAMAANLSKSNIHIEERTLMRRIHSQNVSTIQRSTISKLWSRAIFLLSYIVLRFRLWFKGNNGFNFCQQLTDH